MSNSTGIGLRVNRVDNHEIKQLNALITRLPETRYKEFYVQANEQHDYFFEVKLVSQTQANETLSQIREFVPEERIEVVNQ